MQKWLTVVLLAMLVLAGAMGLRNVVTARAGPVTMASGSAPVPPTPWMTGGASISPAPWTSGSAPVPPTPWAK